MARRSLLLGLACAAALMLQAAPAHATDESWGEGIEVMADDDMDEQRGGFAAGGIEFGFGAVITTTVDGVPVMQTQLTWTDAGAVIERIIATLGQRLEDMSPQARAALGLEGLDGAGGIVIKDAQGVTAMVHNVTDGALQNILVNTASDRDIRQEIDVTLTLPGFEAIQDAYNLERFGMRVGEDLNSVMIGLGGD